MNQGSIASHSLPAGDDSNSSLYRRLLVSTMTSKFSIVFGLLVSAFHSAIDSAGHIALFKNGTMVKQHGYASLIGLSIKHTRLCRNGEGSPSAGGLLSDA
jgi:hypothetical protein